MMKTSLVTDNLPYLLSAIIIIISIVIFCIRKRQPGVYESSSAIVTTTGIACTFIGITEGLYGFNTVGDLATLLNGLKTAFIPSTIAVLIAIIFKFATSKSSETRYTILFQELVASNKLIAEILAQQYPLIKSSDQTEILTEVELRKLLNASNMLVKSDDLAVFINYSLGVGSIPSLVYKLKGDQLIEATRMAAGLDIPVIEAHEIAEKIYHKYETQAVIPYHFMETLYRLAKNNLSFLTALSHQLTQLIAEKGSFVLTSGNDKLAILLNCSKDALPIVLFIAHGNLAKTLLNAATKADLPLIKERKVAAKIEQAGKNGEYLPKALVPDIGAIVGDNYALIEPFFKGTSTAEEVE
jgi:type III secretion system FlhB-like substrate exporter/uncharacterized membrane protein